VARVAIVLAEDFEDSEFRKPYDALREAGHIVEVLGIEQGVSVTGKKGHEKIRIEAAAADCDPEDYEALVIPGGYSPDHLRIDKGVVEFVHDMVAGGKLVAAVCHGPQLLIEVDAVKGKHLTSWPSVKKDLENAGAKWVDKEVVSDGLLITSRKPADLGAFSAAILKALGGTKQKRAAHA